MPPIAGNDADDDDDYNFFTSFRSSGFNALE